MASGRGQPSFPRWCSWISFCVSISSFIWKLMESSAHAPDLLNAATPLARSERSAVITSLSSRTKYCILCDSCRIGQLPTTFLSGTLL